MDIPTISGITVITGGSSGIGEACARLFSKRGAMVVIVDIDQRGQNIAEEIGGKFYLLDVTQDTDFNHVAQSIRKDLGTVEHLINCAGVIQQPYPPHKLEMNTWDDIVRVDQRGTYISCVIFSEMMMELGRGTITNIASITATRSVPLHAYAPAKAAVVSMTECLAAEWGPHGIRVNAISPGHTMTPALQRAIDNGERDTTLLESNALGRMVRADEIAKAAVFLASDEATAVTGINLPVDCGWLVSTSWQTYGGLRKHSN